MSSRPDMCPGTADVSGAIARAREEPTDGPIGDPDALRRALERSEYRDVGRIRSLISRAEVAVLVADDRARYVAVNEAACALTGYTESELVGMSLPDLTAPVDAAVADRLWTAFVDHQRQRGDFALWAKDRSAVIVRYEAIANVVPGLHVSFLRPLAPPGRTPAGSVEPAAPGEGGSRAERSRARSPANKHTP